MDIKNYDKDFWNYLNKLVQENEIVIDRPKGSKHPKYPDIEYMVDYGFIKNTKAIDGNEIDVFKGSLHNKNVSTIICTIDLLKKDIEIKILIGCTEIEKQKVYDFLNNSEYMKAILIQKEIHINNFNKNIFEIESPCNRIELIQIFEDVVFNPSDENIDKILLDYIENKDKKLYGYYIEDRIIGIIGIQNNTDNIEVLHFGIHPEYRSRKLGSELMDYIKQEKKTIILETDDDAVIFYKKYGFECVEFLDERKGKRYNCKYEQ